MINNYLQQGINIIAVNENKQAIFPWKIYQSKTITQAELDHQLADHKAKGIAIICGSVSGNLEVIDIDTKYQTYDLWLEIQKKIPQAIFSKLQIAKTKNNGFHLYYKCECIEGNMKLAQRYPTDEEKKQNPSIKTYCIIETRGEGGYVVAPPTEGYTLLQEGINVITLDERDELLNIMRSFNEVIEEIVIEAHDRPSPKDYGLSPFEDYNQRGDIVALLASHGWKVIDENSERIYFLRPGSEAKHSGSYNKNISLFSVFSTNTPFAVQKGYKLAAVFAILECNADFKMAAKKLLELGFGEKKTNYGNKLEKALFKKKKDGLSNDELVTFLVQKHNKDISESQTIVEELDKRWGKQILEFWDIDDNNGSLSINRYKLQIFLTKHGGFRLYFYDPNSTIYRLIRIQDGFVEEASTEQIKRFIKDYIDKLPDNFDNGTQPQDLLELIYKGASILFSDAFFEFFDRADIDFLKDDKKVSYFPFINGVVVLKDKTIELKTYGELNKCIWKSQVINHYITIDQDFELDKCEYFNFIKKICNDEPERYIYGLSLIGYLLHKYKDPARPYAVILAEETENEQTGGGTGKGIFVKALSYILNTVRVDGKNFKVDKNFAFQRVDLDTRILAIEDTRRNVDFEGFYSIITEGVTVEKKNKDELFIPYADSPKVLFTTNYTIPNNGNHAKRRQRVFEFAPAFNSKYTPEDFFGHKLFDDWDKDEWNRFYNLMFEAVQGYLGSGIIVVENSDKLLRKQIRVQYGEEFLDYLFQMAEENPQWVKLEQLYNDFLTFCGFEKKDYSVKRFTKAIEESCTLMKIAYQNKRDKASGGKKVYKFSYIKVLEEENEEKGNAISF
jgi:hypothetical protein